MWFEFGFFSFSHLFFIAKVFYIHGSRESIIRAGCLMGEGCFFTSSSGGGWVEPMRVEGAA